VLCTRSVPNAPRLAGGAGVGALCIIPSRQTGDRSRPHPLLNANTEPTRPLTPRGAAPRGPRANQPGPADRETAPARNKTEARRPRHNDVGRIQSDPPHELPIGAFAWTRCVYYQLVPEQPPGLPPPVPTAHVRVTVPLAALSVKASPVDAAVEVSV
jgi:hypothetical protein